MKFEGAGPSCHASLFIDLIAQKQSKTAKTYENCLSAVDNDCFQI